MSNAVANFAKHRLNTQQWVEQHFDRDRLEYEGDIIVDIHVRTEEEYLAALQKIEVIYWYEDCKEYPVGNIIGQCIAYETAHDLNTVQGISPHGKISRNWSDNFKVGMDYTSMLIMPKTLDELLALSV